MSKLRKLCIEAMQEAFGEWMLRMHGRDSTCDHLMEGEALVDRLLGVLGDKADEWEAETREQLGDLSDVLTARRLLAVLKGYDDEFGEPLDDPSRQRIGDT